MKLSPKLCSTALLAIGVVVAAGCSGEAKRSKVSGVVSYKGTPLKGGTLTFTSDSSGTYNCQIHEGGAYSITDLPLGTYGVVIDTEFLNPEKRAATMSKAAAGQQGERARINKQYMEAMGRSGGSTDAAKTVDPATKEEMAKIYTKIPAKYLSKVTSGQQLDVSGTNTVKNFELTD